MNDDARDAVKSQNTTQSLIDIDAVFKKKGGKLYPFIPRILIRYLKRIVHQDALNEALIKYENRYGLDFLKSILTERFTVDIHVKHEENIPAHGRYVLVSNHPLGGLDGMALMHVIGKKRNDIKFVSNDLLMELKNLQSLFVPVNKHGRNSAESVRAMEEVYESDALVLIFPAGMVSRKQKGGIIKDLEWKKSFVTKAIKHKRDILPVHIEGKNSEFFYNLSRLRKKLGVKMNIEMLYLVDEMFKQADKKLTITFGKPIPYSVFTKDQSHYEWAQWVKEKVYEIPEEQAI